MDIHDAYYHAIRQHIDRVLTAMGPARVDKGLTAFVDGNSNWSQCFFARAFAGELDLASCPPLDNRAKHEYNASNPEVQLMRALGIPSVIPIRTVYQAFDGMAKLISRDELERFIRDVQAKQYRDSADRFLDSITIDESKPIEITTTCAV